MNKKELASFNEDFNRNLSKKLADKDLREQKVANEAHRASSKKTIV
jgi:hypothetical protein